MLDSDLATETGAMARARYLTPTNAFREKLPPVPAVMFTAERDSALAPDAPTGMAACDIADRLASPVPATTPLLLARYVNIRAGDSLSTSLRATVEIYYVIRGSGETASGADRIAWSQGDVFCLPGGSGTHHRAMADAVLWCVTNEPEVGFHRLEPPAAGAAVIAPCASRRPRSGATSMRCARPATIRTHRQGRHFRHCRLREDAERHAVDDAGAELAGAGPGAAGAPAQFRRRDPADRRRTLLLDDRRAAGRLVALRDDGHPPAAAHSHHNEGGGLATFLIVQDGGLYYHCRTIGFSFT